MRAYFFCLVSLLALTCPAIAVQTPVGFNISLQEPAQVQLPASTYAAGSFQAGTWNRLDITGTAIPLVDVNNSPTAVTVEASSWWQHPYPQMSIPTLFGDDELLLGGGFLIHDPGASYDISGLAPGDYALFTYALNYGWSVGASLTVQGVSLDFWSSGSSPSSPVPFTEGYPHRIHRFTVQQGQVVHVSAIVLMGEEPVRIQGFQIVPIDALHNIQFCDGVANSTGSSARMVLTGSSSVQANNLQLGVRHLPPNQIGYFVVSRDPGTGLIPLGSQGNLCIGGNIGRHNRAWEVLFSGSTGTALMNVNLTDIPQPTGPISILPIESLYWQFWYRDMNPNSTSNFSDAYRIGFIH